MRNQTQACARLMSNAEVGRLAAPFGGMAPAGDPELPVARVGALDQLDVNLQVAHRTLDTLQLRLSRATTPADGATGYSSSREPNAPHVRELVDSSAGLADRLAKLLDSIEL